MTGDPQKPVSPTMLTQLDVVVLGGRGVLTGGDVLVGGTSPGVTGVGDTADTGDAGVDEPPPPHHAVAKAHTVTNISPRGRGE
jgi:hypothetical protein